MNDITIDQIITSLALAPEAPPALDMIGAHQLDAVTMLDVEEIEPFAKAFNQIKAATYEIMKGLDGDEEDVEDTDKNALSIARTMVEAALLLHAYARNREL